MILQSDYLAQRKMNPQKPKPKNPILFVLSAKNWTLSYVKIKFWFFDTPGIPGGRLYRFEKIGPDPKSADLEARSSLTHLRKETQ